MVSKILLTKKTLTNTGRFCTNGETLSLWQGAISILALLIPAKAGILLLDSSMSLRSGPFLYCFNVFVFKIC